MKDSSILKKLTIITLSLTAILGLPYIGSLIHNKEGFGTIPSDLLSYPPIEPHPKAGFNLIFFCILAFIGLALILLYFFPKLFRFKKTIDNDYNRKKGGKFPIWFWIGILAFFIPLGFLISGTSEPAWLLNWSDLPLFWGFIFIIDGITFKRTAGESIIGSSPREMVGLAVASVSGYLLFEYLNLFVGDLWYYEFGDLMPANEFLLYAIVGSSGLMPMAFVWYSLLRTFKIMRNRFDNGIKLKFSDWLKNVILVFGFASLVCSVIWPDLLFFSIWMAPLLIIAVLLSKMGIWSPFKEIEYGNWTPVLLFAVSYLFQGLCIECWNYLSGTHVNGVLETSSAAYWKYSLPYVENPKLFEMPLVGYLGYFPFSIFCWLWWILYAFQQGIPSKFANLQSKGN
tara:strand:+ start:420 stop:1613 length:1194 start_codon:yes stop_codon:yes gene_type:complete